MPYRWTISGPTQTLSLWPHRSLPPKGFVIFIAITCGMFLFPLLAVLGSPILWALLPHIGLAVALTWFFLRRSNQIGLHEDLILRADRVTLTHHAPRRPPQTWDANPYWVRVQMHPTDGPVDNYVTLTGNDRTVEIGAFLSPEERETLFSDLQSRLSAVRSAR